MMKTGIARGMICTMMREGIYSAGYLGVAPVRSRPAPPPPARRSPRTRWRGTRSVAPVLLDSRSAHAVAAQVVRQVLVDEMEMGDTAARVPAAILARGLPAPP